MDRLSAGLDASFEKRYPRGPAIRAAIQVSSDRPAVTVLFGPSGAGKTTILRCLAGLERPEMGHIHWGDEIWLDRHTFLPPQRRRVGYLAQEDTLFPHLTVAQNIAFGLRAPTSERVAELMALMSLVGLEDRRPRELSGGERQRVALARTLAPRPRLLLLDEPLAALDQALRQRLRAELSRLVLSQGIPAVVVTHDAVDAQALGDRLIILDRGTVVQAGHTAEVFRRPVSATAARIVGVENILPATILAADAQGTILQIGALRLPGPPWGNESRQVYACVRGEDVALTGDGENPVATIQSVTPEGPLSHVVVDAGSIVVALVPSRTWRGLGLQPGSCARLAVAPADIHLVQRKNP